MEQKKCLFKYLVSADLSDLLFHHKCELAWLDYQFIAYSQPAFHSAYLMQLKSIGI